MNAGNFAGGNPAGGRRESDFYPTPPGAVGALIEALHLDYYGGNCIWEPACGDGDMVHEIQGYLSLKCFASDIRYGQDFLEGFQPPDTFDFDWIITNPPFSEAEEFIRKAAEYDCPFAMLLKSNFFQAQKRIPLFQEMPPSCVLPLTWRLDFHWKDEDRKGHPVFDCAWFVWDPFACHKGTLYSPIRKPKWVGR